MMRRRLAWRRLKPVKMKQNFVTAATSTNVATAPPGLCICNTASVVGVVDPSQGTTHEEFKTVSVNLDAIKIELDPNKHVPAPGFSAGTLVTQTYVNMTNWSPIKQMQRTVTDVMMVLSPTQKRYNL